MSNRTLAACALSVSAALAACAPMDTPMPSLPSAPALVPIVHAPSAPSPSHVPSDYLIAYTDGSKKQATSKAGWSSVIVRRDTHPGRQPQHPGYLLVEQYGPVVTSPLSPYHLGADSHTNNTAELSGIAEALLWFIHYRPTRAQPPQPCHHLRQSSLHQTPRRKS